MRAIIVLGAIWTITMLFGDAVWLAPLADDGTLSAVREASLMVLLVLVVDWLFLPGVDLWQVISRGVVSNKHIGETTLPAEVRAAVIRGWFTFIAALVIAIALIQYT